MSGLNKTMVEPPQDDADKASLDAILALVASDLQRVNLVIQQHMHSSVPLIPQLASHIIAAGGKRLRPILTLASAQLAGYTGDKHLALAAAVEFIHTATLLHDDVVDTSELRRGMVTANVVWGNKPSVLVGDFLFSRAFRLTVETGSLDVLHILSNASAILAEGEVLQLVTANDIETTEDAYLQVVAAKTAALFSAAGRLGMVIAGRSSAEIEALDSYGHNLGMAFQLIDDMLDYSARQAELGKSVGDDFRDGKMTLPVVLALQRGTAEEHEFWRRTMEVQDLREGDLETAIALLGKYGTLEETGKRARAYADEACVALAIFPPSPIRAALIEVAEFCVSRSY